MDAAYADKLDGKIPEDFWERKMTEWRAEEQQVKMAIDGLASAATGDRALDAQKAFELANKAFFSVHFAGFDRTGQTAQNDVFELFCGCRKCRTCIQISFQSDLRKCQIGRMFGTTRFELTTSPTPILETTQSE
jgi:hypothetical protein